MTTNTTPETGYVRGPGTGRLFFRWHPAPEPSRGLLVFVHGFAEHSGRYLHVYEWMNAHGWDCYGIDYRGHGRADGRRGYCDRFAEYLDDVATALDLARERRPDVPTFLVGHSMGGLIVSTFAIDRQPDVSGICLSGPAMGIAVAVPAWKDALGKVMARWWPTLKIPTGLDPALVSRDPEVVAAYKGDPLVFTTATARWYDEFVATQARIVGAAGRVSVPTIVLQGERDGIVSPDAARRFYDGLRVDGARWCGYPELYHEVFNEPEKEQVFEDLDAWLTEVGVGEARPADKAAGGAS